MGDAREGRLDSHHHLTQGANGGVRLEIPRNGILRRLPAQRSHHYGDPVSLCLVKGNPYNEASHQFGRQGSDARSLRV
ncbi:hypothetical protein [Sodalis sp. (in: enterobacteria)]|uniref:hypothetical protein n=1 Tax=Sodalis sp. (in: enterobacteria) TaxID=1898979 RepID=UPI003F687156